MRILTIGGGRFSGRALTGLASDAGHDVTMFHRGSGPDDPWPAAEHVHGDRAEGFGSLAGRPFDAVLDFCGFFPRQIREAADAFPDAGRYLFISSISAHTEGFRAGVTEDQDLFEPPFPDTEEITWDTYGPLKVASEREVSAAYGERATVVRPGYIVGPYDPTDRFTFWVRRAARGGRMVAPAPPDQPMQWIDARDLAAFLLHLVETDTAGTFSAIDAPGRYTLASLLETSARVAGAATTPVWVDADFVRTHELVGTEDGPDPFPMITPEEPHAHEVSDARARAAGLGTRSLDDTVRDTLAWDDERGAPWPMSAGLTPEREAELLAAV
ncbi:MAG TPA: NAD-dependent epimerase/dehydratase family protein, partial [Actinomycetota bacterium]|nr:NAD-dependent epimerase/dehydratase family protein [Actinomycetota bacterium]